MMDSQWMVNSRDRGPTVLFTDKENDAASNKWTPREMSAKSRLAKPAVSKTAVSKPSSRRGLSARTSTTTPRLRGLGAKNDPGRSATKLRPTSILGSLGKRTYQQSLSSAGKPPPNAFMLRGAMRVSKDEIDSEDEDSEEEDDDTEELVEKHVDTSRTGPSENVTRRRRRSDDGESNYQIDKSPSANKRGGEDLDESKNEALDDSAEESKLKSSRLREWARNRLDPTPGKPTPAKNARSLSSPAPLQRSVSEDKPPTRRPRALSFSSPKKDAVESVTDATRDAKRHSAGRATPTAPFDVVKSWTGSADCIQLNGNPYVKLKQVGKGGSSNVYKVMSKDLETLALKEDADNTAIASYKSEINLLASLKGHANIIQLVDHELGSDMLRMVLEFGEIDLAARLKTDKLNENLIRVYWQQMLEAVHTVHQERIVHADLKPANFVFVQGRLKLIDFGIAKRISVGTVNVYRETHVGTINYISPEALMTDSASKAVKLGRASDIWSLGCILYQMVFGQPPFARIQGLVQKLRAISDPKYAIPYLQPDTFPFRNPPLLDVLRGCLNHDADRRATIPKLLRHPFLHPSIYFQKKR